jgi:hypothetical protein
MLPRSGSMAVVPTAAAQATMFNDTRRGGDSKASLSACRCNLGARAFLATDRRSDIPCRPRRVVGCAPEFVFY